MRKIIVTLLAVLMMFVSAPDVLLAEKLASNAEVQMEFDYSASVIAGTIRYISQVPTGEHFHAEYWPENNFGRYSGATRECKTSCISMALSYLGIDRTPADMLLANNGATKVDGWGATYKSVDVSSGMTDYLTAKGIFSPVLIHLPKYSENGHYILLIGKKMENVYQALDPWERAVTTVQINGNSATYTKSGKKINDTIDNSGQWYLYKNAIDDNTDIKEHDAPTIELSEPMEEPKALSKLEITSLTSTSAKLSWKKQSDATGYKVYQKASGQSYKLVKSVSKNTCKVYIKAGKKYYFKVVPYIQYETQKVEGKAGKCEYFCNKITLSAAGDCTLGVDSRYNNRFNEFYKKNNADYFLKNVNSIFEKDDLTIVNMEGTLTESTSRANKAFTFKGKESYAKILTKGSVEVVNMANNHTRDFGSKGLSDTKKALKKEGISYCIGNVNNLVVVQHQHGYMAINQ